MLLLPVELRPSAIHGLGVFAASNVPPGTPVWRFCAGFDAELTAEFVDALPGPARDHVLWYAWWHPQRQRWVLDGDHARFMNHSGNPNTGVPPGADPGVTIALREIAAGEELTCNYHAFDGKSGEKLPPRGSPASESQR